MKVKVELTYKKNIVKGAVYGLTIDGLATSPEIVLPIEVDKRYDLSAEAIIDMGKAVELHPAVQKEPPVKTKKGKK